MSTPLQAFEAGYIRLRGDYQPVHMTSRSASDPLEYWLADKAAWWKPTPEWKVDDGALGTVDAKPFSAKRVDVFNEVQRMWGLLAAKHPTAVWDPFTYRWLIATKVAVKPKPQPGPVVKPPDPPKPAPQPPASDAAVQRARREYGQQKQDLESKYAAAEISITEFNERLKALKETYAPILPDL